MARGPKKHLKRLNAPKAWMLDKLGGVYAPRPSTGPHKLRESLPLVIFLRNRLKYALTNCEVKKIVMQRLIKVDGKVRTDPNYPAGFMGMYELNNVFIIGKATKAYVSLPRGKGVKLSIAEERDKRLAAKAASG
ncbi:40S ribosomal protein S4 [Blattella germanica]|nr:40S ribosomal protein S4 [Blattella germanica]